MQINTEVKIRKTYPQKWAAYNRAQTAEKDQFLKLLSAMCTDLEDLPAKATGRSRLPIRDALFSAIFKVYSTFSARRFMSDLRSAQQEGLITRTPHFNSVLNYLDNPNLTPILHALIRESSLPLKVIEMDFAVDSSGFTTSEFINWRQHKYGGGMIEQHDWVKVHIMCGVKTNIITSVEIHGRHINDSVLFPELVTSTAKNFKIREVSADKAYISGYNFKVVDDLGGMPFIAFKKSNKAGTQNGIWKKMFHYFQYNQEEFMQHYHKRSNVESTFSMIKRKFGDSVRSKNRTAQVNECLCKILCHNICCLIHEAENMGIDLDSLTK